MPAGHDWPLKHPLASFLPLRGRGPYQWANNAHLAFRATQGRASKITLWSAGVITVVNAAPVRFTDAQALEFYPDKAESFLTCRNFQFGAALRHGALV